MKAEQRRRMRIVVLTGAPGVGKTEVGRRLVCGYALPGAVLDTDSVAGIHPWRVDEDLHALIAANLGTCLAGFRQWGARIVVVSGVLLPDRLLPHLQPLIDDPKLDWVFYGLRAEPDELARRILADHKFQDADGRLSWRHLDAEVPQVPGVRLIDTTRLSLAAVVDEILAQEALEMPVQARPGAVAPPRRPQTVAVPAAQLRHTCRLALERAGLPPLVAADLAGELVAAEQDGHASHGVIRVPEYADAIRTGTVDPHATPVTTPTRDSFSVIDARRSVGLIAGRAVCAELVRLTAQSGFGLVGLRASGHLGRLAPLARHVAARNLVMLGFVNFSGAGQKVAPAGGTEGRLATNPIVAAFPSLSGAPVVIDMSTSTSSEGAVRVARLLGRALPDGMLVDAAGHPVNDPDLLYTDPPQAALTPLGGPAGHKGFALAVMVDLLAGVVAGAGHSRAGSTWAGNGGLFIAFSADALGRSPEKIERDIADLEHYVASACRPGRTPPRLPGRSPAPSQRQTTELPAALWHDIRELAGMDHPLVPLAHEG